MVPHHLLYDFYLGTLTVTLNEGKFYNLFNKLLKWQQFALKNYSL